MQYKKVVHFLKGGMFINLSLLWNKSFCKLFSAYYCSVILIIQLSRSDSLFWENYFTVLGVDPPPSTPTLLPTLTTRQPLDRNFLPTGDVADWKRKARDFEVNLGNTQAS